MAVFNYSLLFLQLYKEEVDILDNTYMFENYISIGRSFVAEKNYLKALKFLKKAYACPDGKKDIDLILDLAFLYDKIADFNSAEKMYKMALDIDNTCAIAYYGLGIIYDDDESYEEAIECYKKAIENDNKYEKAYFFLANAYDELGNKEEAIKNYTEVLKLNSKDL